MRSCGGEEGWRPFLFRGLCLGSWDKNANPGAHPSSSSATQRLAEGKASDGDLPCPLAWPELAWSLLRGGGAEGVSGSPRIPVSGAGVAAR